MDNDSKSWFQRNWKWFVPVVSVLLLLFMLISTSGLGIKIAEIAQVHQESEVYENALEIANKNSTVIGLLGELNPLGNLAIIEGSHQYSNDYNTLAVTVTISGSKTADAQIRSKMDVVVHKNKDIWVYESINIRIKSPPELKQTINILSTLE